MIFNSNQEGFTLIEVLIALVIVAIAFTALLKASSQNIDNTRRLKEKAISHWVAMQGVSLIQLHLIPLKQDSTFATQILGQRWYWRVKISATPLRQMEQLRILVSSSQLGPFREEVTTYLHLHE